ncbi:exonuclease [Enterobacter asburiae]|uniref:exonuclease n=1 Tax=Enterobacter asburiae TaxID=61645 RepID=UPI0020058BF1|nr:3'-5' exonuclease [Enterobacter asburiae]MCK6677636.1 3'-5' exoribonuclease [Enterobacter asburiae]
MQTYAFLIKAKAKATDAKHLFCWLSAKSDSRAEREIANILEDADIETGRGAPYLQPVRTDWFVVDDLPEEGVLDATWCDRYELNEDGRSWKLIPASAPEPEVTTSTTTPPSAPVAKETLPATNGEANVLVENHGLAVRVAIHLLNDKYQTHITKQQQIAASELASGESELDAVSAYMRNLLQAIGDVAEFADLSLHVEWKLVQAVKAVFPQDGEHAPALLIEFVTDWIAAEPDSRNQLVEDWQSGKLPAAAPGAQNDVVDTMEHPAAQLGFRQQFLAAYICDEFAHHVTADQRIMISDLMLDVDNHYVQNLLLAAENVAEAKKYSYHDIWKLTADVKKVLPPSGRHELGVVLRFMQAWAATHHIDRGLLLKEWLAGKRVAAIQHTKVDPVAGGELAGGEEQASKVNTPDAQDIPQFYKRAVAQSDANLSIEIAVALLFPRAEPGKISREQIVDAKSYQDRKDGAHIKAVKVLSKIWDILEYNAWSIYGVTHALKWHGDETVADLRTQARQWLTENGTYENGQPSKGYPEWDEDPRSSRHSTAAESSMPNWAKSEEQQNDGDIDPIPELQKWARQQDDAQPEVANLGKGIFSIDNLMSQQSTSTTTQQNEAADVPMEETVRDEIQTGAAVPAGEATNVSTENGAAAGSQTTAIENNIDTGHQNDDGDSSPLMTHVMTDLETMGNNPEAPIVAIGAVFFDPGTGKTGEEFYQVVSLESAMEFGAKPDAATIIWWMKQSSEARAAITGGDAISLMDAIDNLDEFIHSNSASGIKNVQLWGNGSSFDNVILRRAYEQVGADLSVPYWNDRDVRTIVELGKVVGINPRHQIPFEGDMHNALSDARHQVKYVSAIWQKLTQN